MRRSNRGLRAVTALVAVVLVAGCGSGTGTPIPSAPATPAVTPDPHLAAPAHVDDVYRLMGAAGLRIIASTASVGTKGDPVKRITATYDDWPLVLTEFSSASALRSVGKFDTSERPRRGEAPYIVAGLNILVEYGPRDTNDPVPLPADPAHQKALDALIGALNPLLGPLAQRSVQTIAMPGGTPVPASQPPAAAQASPGS
jgi:hypothetical protein